VPSLGLPDSLSDVFRRFLHGPVGSVAAPGRGPHRLKLHRRSMPLGLSQKMTVFGTALQVDGLTEADCGIPLVVLPAGPFRPMLA